MNLKIGNYHLSVEIVEKRIELSKRQMYNGYTQMSFNRDDSLEIYL